MGNKRNKELRKICIRKRRKKNIKKHTFDSDPRDEPSKEIILTELTSVNPGGITHKSIINTFDDTAGTSTSSCYRNNELNELTIETEEEADKIENHKPVSGKRLIDITYFISQLKEKANHIGLFDCKLENCILIGEKRVGLLSKFKFKCNMCNITFIIHSENPSEIYPETVNINIAAVTGIVSTGIGFSQFEELMSAIDVPVFTERYFSKLQDHVYDKWEQTSVEVMEAAANKEKEAAIGEGRVKNGTPIIDVYADGCWSARSYGNNYRALSGAAAIIGRRYGEVLYMAVKNKYCLICARAEKKSVDPKEHKCYKNYNGSSTGMEAEIIADGFRTSLEMYNVIYGRLIADGDSSTYNKILNTNPYENHTVEKIECRNHILRNFCNKMRAAVKDTKYVLQHRNTLTNQRIMCMRKAIIVCIRHHQQEINSHSFDTEFKCKKIKILHLDIKNALLHAYGDHRQCSFYMCSKDKDFESSTLAQIDNSTFVFRLRAIIATVAIKARSLIENVDTNSVERFNSIVAKFVGGKRVNFALRRGYQARCAAAVVAFNEKRPISRVHKTILGYSPRGKMKDIENKRILKRHWNQTVARKKNRMLNTNKTVQHEYGSTCAAPDMEPEEFQKAKDNFLDNLKNLTADRISIERTTILQRESSQWFEIRKNLVTASNFGHICKRRTNINTAPLVKNILYRKNLSNVASIAHGLEHEMMALEQLSRQQGVHIEPCGLFIDKKYPFIGATPDGLIGDDTIVEVKCPIGAYKKGIDIAIHENKINLYKKNKKNGNIEINKQSNWYFQVQGQLHVTERKQCIFGIWSGENVPLKIECIDRDDDFWSTKMERKLIIFYDKCLLPELVDPRHIRGMTIRAINLSDENKENVQINTYASRLIPSNISPIKSSNICRRINFDEF